MGSGNLGIGGGRGRSDLKNGVLRVFLDFFFLMFLLMLSIDSDLNSDGPSANILAIEGSNCFVLLLFTSNVNESVTLAPPGLSPATTNNTSGVDMNAGISEESCEAGIFNGETQVGDEEDRLGELSNGIFTSGPLGARGTRFACARFLGGSCVRGLTVCLRSCGFSTLSSGICVGGIALTLRLALKEINGHEMREICRRDPTHVGLFLLLGLGSLISTGSGIIGGSLDLAISLGFRDFTRDGLATASARSSLEPLLLLVFIFLVCWLSDLDDHVATVKLFLTEELDRLLRSFCAGQRDESITRRSGTRASVADYYLYGETRRG